MSSFICGRVRRISELLKDARLLDPDCAFEGYLNFYGVRIARKDPFFLAGFGIYHYKRKKQETYTLLLYTFRSGIVGVNIDHEDAKFFLDVLLSYLEKYELRTVTFVAILDWLVASLKETRSDHFYSLLRDLDNDERFKLIFDVRCRRVKK